MFSLKYFKTEIMKSVPCIYFIQNHIFFSSPISSIKSYKAIFKKSCFFIKAKCEKEC